MRILCFPSIRRIRLTHFSLYTLQDPIEVTFDAGITCLAGANGLGKSTFLQLINYGLTGVVPKPKQKFVSVDDYYRDILGFTEDYFQGRILPEHKEIAEIEIEMHLGKKRILMRRGFVECDSLRFLEITEGKQVRQFEDDSPESRHDAFEELIVEEVGVSSFKEFVFIQSFVLTFDERRYLLFWDPKVLETCLLIFVGVNKEQRGEAERLRREMEKAESQVRNLVYDIKQANDRLENLVATLKGRKSSRGEAKIYTDFETLSERLKVTTDEIAIIEAKTRDAKLAIAESAAKASVLRTDYKVEFDARLRSKRAVRHHPVIKSTLLEGRCDICGTGGDRVRKTIEAALSAGKCPLCESQENGGNEDPKLMARLKELDRLLAAEKKTLDSKTLLVQQLEKDLVSRTAKREVLQKQVSEFEEKHRDVLSKSTSGVQDFEEVKTMFKASISALEKERDKQKARSKKAAGEYRIVQKQLEQQYLVARERFVPIFKELAHLFLGVDLDISLENREKSVTLFLEVKKAKRRADYDLSESQRFFIDIALRMAFARLASSNVSKAPLYIDTPEGSLDLAYEAQAGKMIARFAGEGHHVFMTANINTSMLLLSIAEHSRDCGLSLERMYKWTELSDIQEPQQKRFSDTLDGIEKVSRRPKK